MIDIDVSVLFTTNQAHEHSFLYGKWSSLVVNASEFGRPADKVHPYIKMTKAGLVHFLGAN